MRSSRSFNRKQLVSICATLRGELSALILATQMDRVITKNVVNCVKDATHTLKLSEFVPDKRDLLPSTDGLPDGTYDKSWM